MNALYQELSSATDPGTIFYRVQLLRCYNVLEILRTELQMLCVICRSDILKDGHCFPGGQLLDHYYYILQKVKKREVTYWSLENDITSNLQIMNKKFLDGYIREYLSEVRMGIRIVDLMDILIDIDFSLTVTYDCRTGMCHLVGEYELGDTKFLTLPPDLPHMLESCGRRIKEDEVLNVLEYLITIVRHNNRLLLHDEQYWREMEATRRLQQELQQQGYAVSPAHRHGVISRQPREYSSTRLCRERKILSNGHIIREMYREYTGKKCPFKGFWCRVDLACPIDDSPIEIMENWSRLCLKLKSGKDLEFVSSNNEIEVKILGFLELPRKIVPTLTNPTMHGAYDSEEIVSVHYPTEQQQQQLQNSSFSGQDNKIDPMELGETGSSSCSSSVHLENQGDAYNMYVEFKVCIPVRGFEPEVYKLMFTDGDQEIQEIEINETVF
ncbi:uncharacterized protein [Periplaneta americana]|uniref:uncharacterized protein n=1 Tax=Periplaneta americana TaxID=6978 RepID=UPI0037E7B9D7